MSIVYKKAQKENPREPQQPKKYYPQLLAIGKRIKFRASKSIRPDVNATRAEDKINFIDFDTYVKNMFGTLPGNEDGGDDGGGDVIDPGA